MICGWLKVLSSLLYHPIVLYTVNGSGVIVSYNLVDYVRFDVLFFVVFVRFLSERGSPSPYRFSLSGGLSSQRRTVVGVRLAR